MRFGLIGPAVLCVALAPIFAPPPAPGWSFYDADTAEPLLTTQGLALDAPLPAAAALVGEFHGTLGTSRVELLLTGPAPMSARLVAQTASGATLNMTCGAAECPFAFEPADPGAPFSLRLEARWLAGDAHDGVHLRVRPRG